jgi:hypothetical protein
VTRLTAVAPGAWSGPASPLLLLNDGTGSFSESPSAVPSTAIVANRITMRDFDLDGDVDAFVWSNLGTTRLLYRNDGAGHFTQVVTVPGPAAGTAPIEIGDFNGDGLPDVAYGTWYPGPGATSVWTDGIVMNTGNGTFSSYGATNIGAAHWLTAVDLNGDGADELVRTDGANVSVHAIGGGALLPATQSFVLPGGRFFPRDLDGDGDLDLINDGLVPVLNSANGALVPLYGHVAPSAFGSGPSAIAGDIDGDGDADLISTSGGNGMFLRFANDGAGNFTPTTPCLPGVCPLSNVLLFPLDYDADGRLDFYAGPSPLYPGSAINTLFRNAGGFWTPVATVSNPYPTASLAAADLDGNGTRDLVLGDVAPATAGGMGQSYVALNFLPAGFSGLIALPGLHATRALAVFDADGDSDLDVVEANAMGNGSDSSVLLLNSGSGSFIVAPAAVLSTGEHWSVAARDLDGDGDTDLVFDGQIFLNTAGTFPPGALLQNAAAIIDAFDADLDGDVDLLATSASSNSLILFYNAGNGSFPTSETIPWFTLFAPARADFDGDGDIDLAIGYGPRILTNTTRQIARGSLARPGRTASLDLYGPAGSQWQLWASGGTAQIPVPGWGTVFVDPLTAALFATGTFPASGTASLSGTIANNPALVGFTVWWQAAILPQHGLTNREVIQILGL